MAVPFCIPTGNVRILLFHVLASVGMISTGLLAVLVSAWWHLGAVLACSFVTPRDAERLFGAYLLQEVSHAEVP